MFGPVAEEQVKPGARLWLRVQITGFVLEHQPDILSCAFKDVHGRTHTLVDKSAVLTMESINFRHAHYPRREEGGLECVVLARNERLGAVGSAARSVVRVETCAWWRNVFEAGLISHEAMMEVDDPPQVFEVYGEQLRVRVG